MPNHVINIVTIRGNDVEKVIDSLKGIDTDTGNEQEVDFNTVIPMPEELNVSSGSNEYKAKEVISGIPYELAKTIEGREKFLKDNFDRLLGIDADCEIYLRNYIKHGFTSWYDWSCSCWGTKWNAYEICVEKEEGRITFNTAWSSPDPIFEALSKKFPDNIFHICFADEDIGSNCGSYVLQDGIESEQYFPDGEEATIFACDLWGYDANDYLEEETS